MLVVIETSFDFVFVCRKTKLTVWVHYNDLNQVLQCSNLLVFKMV